MKTLINSIIGTFVMGLILIAVPLAVRSSQINIAGPAASGFGTAVTVLPNGNIVVTAPLYDIPAGASDVGAVYLYDGTTLALISTLTGISANDNVGNGGITVLTNSNFVVRSPNWNSARGAATFCNAVSGCNGIVSSGNSLVGSTANDEVGAAAGVVALTNGNYVVRSFNWDNGANTNAGAVTWGNGATGTSGAVSSANSLVGSATNSLVGFGGVVVLTNGNYVVRSPGNVGAVTWGNGATGTSGAVSSGNSLVGSISGDSVGNGGVVALTNGNYVVGSPNWGIGAGVENAGAVTWGNGTTGISGPVSSTNSLVGSTAFDEVGSGGVVALTNGNYVVGSPSWGFAGAATWGNGTTGISGTVSSGNSLVGSTPGDSVGNGVVALANGNYVVRSLFWNNGAITAAGAVTWGNGATGTFGAVSSANSLVGSTANDRIGDNGITTLTNGNYVVRSLFWDNGVNTNAGAVTWGNGLGGTVGAVSAANSLVGSSANDNVGDGGVVALTNGNYVVSSFNWDNGGNTNAGAVTWGNGATGTSGAVSGANSLVGSTTGDNVGSGFGVVALTNGNYVVRSRNWDNGSITNAGAVTWGNGASGISGAISSSNSLVGSRANEGTGSGSGVVGLTNGNYVVINQNWHASFLFTREGAVTWDNGASGTSGTASSANSLVGSTIEDNVGSGGVVGLTNGNYVVNSPNWDNGATTDAGAFTFGSGADGTTGAITSGMGGGNSVVGTVTNGVNTFAFDPTGNRLLVGRGANNIVSIIAFFTVATANGDVENAANWSNGVPNGLVTGVIPSGRAMTVSSIVRTGLIQVQCGGSLSGGSTTAHIVGSVRRDFCGAAGESFIFPIGDGTNYSPLTASNTNGTGILTATVTDTFMPGLRSTTTSISRYWTLDGAGITADLTFHYVDADVNGTEGGYKLFRRPLSNDALITRYNPSSVDTVNNRLNAVNVSQFSDWGGSRVSQSPTAADVTVGGRVLTAEGRGVRNAVVSLTQANGEVLTSRSSAFGYYRFDDIEAGQTVVVSVNSKRFAFQSQVVTLIDSVADLDFWAQ